MIRAQTSIARTPRAGGPCGLHGDSGFTLLELLVSLVLLGLLMALIAPALRLARQGPAIASELEHRAAADASMAFTAQRLNEATPIYQRGDDGQLQIQFDGRPDQIGFIAPVRFGAAVNGLARFDLVIGSGPGGRQGLILSWKPWGLKPGAGEGEGEGEGDIGGGTAWGGQSRLLIPEARALQLRYFGAANRRDGAAWAESWVRTDALPKLVEIVVTTETGSHRSIATLHLALP